MTAPADDPRGGDDLDRYIAEQQRDPEFRAAFAAAQARPAGDRAQPTQELRELRELRADMIAALPGVHPWGEVVDRLLALPALAALLDAQAAVGRVEALEQTWRRRAVFHAEYGARETAVGLTHRANDLCRALDGT